MKKMNILFILITMILIFGTTNVFADTCTPSVSQDIANLSNGINTTLSLGVNRKEYSFTTPYNVGNVNYIKGHLYYFIKDTSKTITSNINIQETCSQWGNGGAIYNSSGTITYQDGTQASIDIGMQNRMCQAWQSIGSETTTQYFEPSINQVSVNLAGTLNNTNKYYPCDIDSTGTFKCQVEPNYNITSIIFRFYLEKSQIANINYGLMSANIESCSTDTQQIINNNNQNTQTIVNNITDNQINTSDTDTSNIISIPNSNGKNTILDLLMVPINFISSIINSFSNSCVSYNLGNLLGTDLILPCVNLQNILGSGLYNIIDAIFAFGMIFAFIRSVKKFIQKALMLTSDVSSEVSIF